MRKLLGLAISAVITAGLMATLIAQSATPSFKLAWDQAEPLTQVQDYKYTLKIDNAAPAEITPACTAKGAGSTCTAPLPALASGPHTLTLTAFNGFGSASADPLSGAPPQKPSNVSVTVTIIIQ